MKTNDLTKEQLQVYFNEHICYEIQHLFNTTSAILQELRVPNGLQYVVVESFAIHLRNLIFFFYPYKPRDTDVCAKDFFLDEKTWENVRPELSEVLKEAQIRASKEVGHLTTARKNGTPENKAWNVKELTKEIMPIIELFSATADKIKADLPADFLKVYSVIKDLPPKS